MADNAIYNAAKGLIESFVKTQSDEMINVLRSGVSTSQAELLIREARAKIKLCDNILYYINQWRKKSLTEPIKEDENGSKKKRR